MTVAALICSVSALALIIVSLPGWLSYAWEEHRIVRAAQKVLLTVMLAAVVAVCVLAVA